MNHFRVFTYIALVWHPIPLLLMMWLYYKGRRQVRNSRKRWHAVEVAEASKPAPGPKIPTFLWTPLPSWTYLVVALVGMVSILWYLLSILDSLELHLPVPLPDPEASGLNQILSDSNLTLHRCETAEYHFYVGFSDNCAQLGDPFAGLSLGTKHEIQRAGGSVPKDLNVSKNVPKGLLDQLGDFWIVFAFVLTAGTLPGAMLEVIRLTYYCCIWFCMGRRKGDSRYPSNGNENNQGHQVDEMDMELVP